MEVTYGTIKGSVASVVVVWALIEQSARTEIIRAHGELPKSAHGIAAALDLWHSTVIATQPATSRCAALATILRDRLRKPLEIRNGICHGLYGISASTEKSPATLKWELNGEKHSISWDDLSEMLGWLSKIHHVFAMISSPKVTGVQSRIIDSAENREWWRSEYALDLPE